MDIKFDESGDLDFGSGDIRYTDATPQHKMTVLMLGKGDLKEHPDVGVGAIDYLLDDSPSGLLRETRRQCSRIGIKVNRVTVENGIISIEGGYEDSSKR